MRVFQFEFKRFVADDGCAISIAGRETSVPPATEKQIKNVYTYSMQTRMRSFSKMHVLRSPFGNFKSTARLFALYVHVGGN